MHRLRSPALALILSIGAMLVAAPANAAPPDAEARAQALYDEGMTALEARQYDKACPKFEEASRLVPEGIGVKLMLAQCYEESDKLASALTQYRIAEEQARAAKQDERQKKAAGRIAAIEKRVAHLRLDFAPDVASLAGL